MALVPRGRGQQGRHDRRRPERGPYQPNRICLHFQRGRCTYGPKCKFSHDADSTENFTHSADNGEIEERYVAWKRLLRKSKRGTAAMGGEPELMRFWSDALNILDTESREHHQYVAKDLVEESLNGYHLVMETMEMTSFTSTATNAAEIFLKVITHPSMLDCLSVDAFVGTLYTFFGGTNGERAINFLTDMSASLNDQRRGDASPSSFLSVTSSMLIALHELLARDRRARFQDDLALLLDSLETNIEENTTKCALYELDAPRARLNAIRRIVSGAVSRISRPQPNQDNSRPPKETLSTFPRDLEIPGGRHDNDLADITSIEILPTYSEIISDHAEYLPTTNFLHPHVLEDPFQRYIDSTFRLLRHDTFGTVKDVLRDVLKQTDSTFLSKDTRAHFYTPSYIQHLFMNERDGLQAIIAFPPLPQLRYKSLAEQCQWWQDSSRLDEGTLVCLLWPQANNCELLFLEVTIKTCISDHSKKKQRNAKDEEDKREEQSNLVSGKSPPSITVKLAHSSQAGVDCLTRFFVQKSSGMLIDFRGIIPGTFVPIIKNLQQMQRDGEMVLQRWILPGSDAVDITPPRYAEKPGFKFSLAPITKDGSRVLQLDPHTAPDSVNTLEMEALTGLDAGQCRGLVGALTREYALIQGPPGTGKSYLGVQLVRVLLGVKEKAKLGPLLIICYTNHALDQFLEHLLDVGVEKIIRVGGQSRAARLDSKNIRVVRRETRKTRTEETSVGEAYGSVKRCTLEAAGHLNSLQSSRKGPTWACLRSFLRKEHPLIHKQFGREDSEGFETVTKDRFGSWMGDRWHNRSPVAQQADQGRSLVELTRTAEKNIYALTPVERWRLAESWLEELREEDSELLFEYIDQAGKWQRQKNNVHDELDRRTLSQADVVGLTTTGLSRNIHMLRRLHSKVIICEEAAEVMEAHVISALMPGVEHFIQIGDHKQLRPQIQNFSLSLESSSGAAWQLDRSQFERRAVGEPGMSPATVAQLTVQRRMRPEISRLIGSVYPDLHDHENVTNLPNVVGMSDNVFWLDHRRMEDKINDGIGVNSHSNEWEVAMAIALVRHLVRQGVYSSNDIALLVPYTGQLRKLRAVLSMDFEISINERDMETLASDGNENPNPKDDARPQEGFPKSFQKRQLLQTLRLATVDNFQGEEAKVIIVSLVRSNPAHKVGFLRTENRINVLLSRAQHGMYLIGNTETYLHVPMWADVHDRLASVGAVGKQLALCCPRHPETRMLCSEPVDFERSSPEGGCSLPCDKRLSRCGHKCLAPCHSAVMHDAFSCCQDCPRVRSTCDHECPKLCGEDCGRCLVKVDGVKLPCGHAQNQVDCYKLQDLSVLECEVSTSKTVPGCGHSTTVTCSTDVMSKYFACRQPCSEILGCGHLCGGSCGKCQTQHPECGKICDRPYGTCNHRCPKSCHEDKACGDCEAQCEVRCPHSACGLKCGEACAPCIERCTWYCVHKGSCSMPCAAPCDRIPCDQRCSRMLDCGHQCPGFCGEDCPVHLCQMCCDKGDSRVDLLEFKSYSEVDLDESPIVMLGCGHFFTGETLDGLVGVDEVYTRDGVGNFLGLKDASTSLSGPVPSCPDCKQPIRQYATKRYNRVVNRAVMDETCKRYHVKGLGELDAIEQRLKEAERQLDSTRFMFDTDVDDQVSQVQRTTLKTRYAAANRLEHEAKDLGKRMDIAHQPTRKLLDAIVMSQFRAGDGIGSLSLQMDRLRLTVPAAEKQLTLRAQLIAFKVTEITLHDKLTLLSSNKNLLPFVSGKQLPRIALRFLRDCWDLIAQARGASLSRITITAIMAFAKASHVESWCRGMQLGQSTGDLTLLGPVEMATMTDRADTARRLLSEALELCSRLQNTEGLRDGIRKMMQLSEDRYEQVTPEEMESIKSAMVSGVGGIATHSGHWYNCANGHPFAIGECGMPMELARCPECGATIGGEHHQQVEGVSRAVDME